MTPPEIRRRARWQPEYRSPPWRTSDRPIHYTAIASTSGERFTDGSGSASLGSGDPAAGVTTDSKTVMP